ncbi:hypothetical protein QYE76_017646 [Lolium multiflorum]|uniref:Uncharacterized protein n=1 Tax=Lolium multiflorum TaxID=4521 RepID=A0AAD8V258_LOLMU|nr:hypothetical protein QYE76_017646 [Lolium multiflorum]
MPVALISVDGIRPLVSGSMQQVMEAMPATIYFETQDFTATFIDSIRHNEFILKGGLVTPVGGGFYILNMQLYKELNLYASPINYANIASSGINSIPPLMHSFSN